MNEAGFLLLVALIALYFLPIIVAASRGHPGRGGVFVLNLFLGWTLVGWVVALAWAAGAVDKASRAAPAPATPSVSASTDAALDRLARLKAEGALTTEEFEAAKQRVLAGL
ncbi:MAG: superinfection immunity protein [Parvularculaceae bacterium]|nr:superinfection immunity protein [Parvularculaceae bacterium]